MLKFMLAGALTLAATGAYADVVTPTNLQGWSPANVRAEGSVAITSTYRPAGDNGSLEFNTGPSNASSGLDKADFVNYTISGTLGDLISNGALNYDYYVNSSSTSPVHLAPALRLFFQTSNNETGYLIWERGYNTGGPVGVAPTDTWVSNDILGGNFWMRAFGPGRTIEKYDYSLADWAGGATFGSSIVLSNATLIRGIEVGVGSGWGGSFHGAVDNVTVSFGERGQGLSSNFEVAGGAVPEPATWAMMIAGFGLAGAGLRRRRSLAVTAG